MAQHLYFLYLQFDFCLLDFYFYSCLPLQTVQVPVYSEQEYQVHLHDDGWTKAETDHLFDLCKRFDLRFVVVHDRYDHQQYRVIAPSLVCYACADFILQRLKKKSNLNVIP